MAGEIEIPLGPDATAWTVYAVVRQPGTAKLWNTGTLAFEAYNGAHESLYSIATVHKGRGTFLGDFPGGVTAAGTYPVEAYRQAGGSPAAGDTQVAEGTVGWTGTAEDVPDLGAVSGFWWSETDEGQSWGEVNVAVDSAQNGEAMLNRTTLQSLGDGLDAAIDRALAVFGYTRPSEKTGTDYTVIATHAGTILRSWLANRRGKQDEKDKYAEMEAAAWRAIRATLATGVDFPAGTRVRVGPQSLMPTTGASAWWWVTPPAPRPWWSRFVPSWLWNFG